MTPWNLTELNYHVFVRSKESGAVEEIKESHLMRYLFRRYTKHV